MEAKFKTGEKVLDRKKFPSVIETRLLEQVGFEYIVCYRIRHLHSGSTYKAYEEELSRYIS